MSLRMMSRSQREVWRTRRSLTRIMIISRMHSTSSLSTRNPSLSSLPSRLKGMLPFSSIASSGRVRLFHLFITRGLTHYPELLGLKIGFFG
ncbi:hypothetical protein PAXRUDRAFT_669582 [Paxillus rubicundulus Ve08.2h10]|uniref:Unplaced genomic scaffold scaffold_667, whole genome shotgun sequence n=1 Tax=Paxillus rubicundulus Ve08.2h10 TaxID=930991 RepID=A0A0D0DRV8_9AGAM|nr:hypothetical protein PAXRUDRAFT_669582 [Paxillus rubicundulus Ve08.2h10]